MGPEVRQQTGLEELPNYREDQDAGVDWSGKCMGEGKE